MLTDVTTFFKIDQFWMKYECLLSYNTEYAAAFSVWKMANPSKMKTSYLQLTIIWENVGDQVRFSPEKWLKKENGFINLPRSS